ncbi:MAG: tail fiber domain-containing protein [Chitinophagaceae bacterium]|nr:tail fiber domain-containing protein [Chitinophagaceae bacterium]MBN8668485.1 tail fiber domain-containing protein [Chitinophagales bacterium]
MKKHVNALLFALFILLGTASTINAQSISDQEIKTNIQSIAQPLQKLNALEPQVFEYNTKRYAHLSLPKGLQYGFMTENVEKVLPGAINTTRYSFMKGKNSYQQTLVRSTDLQSLIPLLVASIKEQQSQIDVLKAEVEMLKKKAGM